MCKGYPYCHLEPELKRAMRPLVYELIEHFIKTKEKQDAGEWIDTENEIFDLDCMLASAFEEHDKWLKKIKPTLPPDA